MNMQTAAHDSSFKNTCKCKLTREIYKEKGFHQCLFLISHHILYSFYLN